MSIRVSTPSPPPPLCLPVDLAVLSKEVVESGSSFLHAVVLRGFIWNNLPCPGPSFCMLLTHSDFQYSLWFCRLVNNVIALVFFFYTPALFAGQSLPPTASSPGPANPPPTPASPVGRSRSTSLGTCQPELNFFISYVFFTIELHLSHCEKYFKAFRIWLRILGEIRVFCGGLIYLVSFKKLWQDTIGILF